MGLHEKINETLESLGEHSWEIAPKVVKATPVVKIFVDTQRLSPPPYNEVGDVLVLLVFCFKQL